MPGIGLDIDGAIQQAPQSLRQSISATPGGLGKRSATIAAARGGCQQNPCGSAIFTHFSRRLGAGLFSHVANKRPKHLILKINTRETCNPPALHASYTHVPLS
jgi:hypothetical protein